MSTRWQGRYVVGDKGRERIVPIKQLKQQWSSPLTEARPPARPRAYDWVSVTVWASLVAFWGVVLVGLYAIGVL